MECFFKEEPKFGQRVPTLFVEVCHQSGKVAPTHGASIVWPNDRGGHGSSDAFIWRIVWRRFVWRIVWRRLFSRKRDTSPEGTPYRDFRFTAESSGASPRCIVWSRLLLPQTGYLP